MADEDQKPRPYDGRKETTDRLRNAGYTDKEIRDYRRRADQEHGQPR